jgi:hypothetical protein
MKGCSTYSTPRAALSGCSARLPSPRKPPSSYRQHAIDALKWIGVAAATGVS